MVVINQSSQVPVTGNLSLFYIVIFLLF